MLTQLRARIHRWRHTGEEDAVRIYIGRWKLTLLFRCCALMLTAWALALVGYLRLVSIFVPLSCGFLVLMLIGEWRRAVIFTVGTVTYRPRFGAAQIIAFQRIRGLQRAVMSVTGRDATPAIAVDLIDGRTEMWPLPFVERSEIADRLSAATGQPVTGKWSRWYT